MAFLGGSPPTWLARQRAVAAPPTDLLGGPPPQARLLSATLGGASARFRHALVTESPLSETERLDFNYLHWVRTTTVAALWHNRLPVKGGPPAPLLYRMVRHALLRVYSDAAFGVHVQAGLAAEGDRR